LDQIKIYNDVHPKEKNVSFAIKRMEDYWSIQQSQPDEPHRHGYYTVLLVLIGEGEHIIDFHSYPLGIRQVFFVSPGQVHQVVERRQSLGFVVTFDTNFLVHNNIPLSFIKELGLFRGYGDTPPLDVEPIELNRLVWLCSEMLDISNSATKYREQALGSLLQLFLIQCNNLYTSSINNTEDYETSRKLLQDFKGLIEENYANWHNTSRYAAELHITPDYLNRVIKMLTGKTAKELIQGRITIEAKRQLYFTDLSSKEIGYLLGFSEPANFSSFFKNCTGETPSTFRNNHHQLV